MMMIKSLQHLFLAISSLLLLLSANALVPNDCLSCRGSNTAAAAAATAFRARSPFTSLPSWKQPQTRSLSKHSSLVVLLSATAVDDSLVESKQKTQPPSLPPNDDNDGELDLSSRIINFVFLALAFGYAAYTILNIDNGMTRGWTTGEIAMRIPLDNWGAYEDYLANKPIFTKTLINVIIYLLGDWLSQTAFQGKNVLDFDISRTLRNGFIGLCFGPLVHEYYQFSDTILPPENGFVTRLEKIFMDQTIYLTVKCSIYISAVGLLGGDDLATVKQTVQDKIGGVVVTAWKFWPLVHCITYGLIPARHRILWVNSVDLVWNAILASKAQKTDEDEDGSEEGGEGEASSLVLDAVAVEIENDEQEPAQAHNSLKGAGDEVPSLILENNNKLSLVEEESSSEHNTVAAEVMELNGTMVSGSNSTEKGVLVAP
ncbi:unnamed protein product [Cylindrotheca closterium]|uniref:Peroxisomal membrane protein MPV17 n=1 Tax=Cylindrotheca closterium TaxID=2856 RepID=A0AAD2CPT8_9STRA|nr:unnamed protein product [Cylindrotheca closterium]